MRGRGATALIIAALLALAGLGAAVGALLGASRAGLVRPPGFSVALGDAIFAAPCPPEMGCPEDVPYYAVWQGERHPDGSTTYRLRYFTYLPRRR
jgi:hypothetical protein